jgi:hypothetical protein
MAFLPKHRSRILNKVPVSKSRIQNGTIIEFRYKKKDGSSGLYMAIVLSVWPPAGGISKKLIHSLSMDYLSDNHLRRFVKRIGQPSVDEDVRTQTGKEISKFLLPEGRQAPKRFYKIKLDKIPGIVEEAYRTFSLKNMSQIKQLDYDFKNLIPKKFLGEISED